MPRYVELRNTRKRVRTGELEGTPGTKKAAVIVAHPDDEVLWAGGTVLSRPQWQWEIYALCRASDPDRALRFLRTLRKLEADGAIGDLDDGPDQPPLDLSVVRTAIVSLLPHRRFNLVLTHGPRGEYTRHRRHEETCRAVVQLWSRGLIETEEVWMFAYEDSNSEQLPVALRHADRYEPLPTQVWERKHCLITEYYGFAPGSWEAQATPRAEAFWCFDTPQAAQAWLESQGDPR